MTFHGLAEYLFIAHKLSKISERHENIRYSKKKKKIMCIICGRLKLLLDFEDRSMFS